MENVPTVIFTHPPIGVVGLTEEKANAKWGSENVKIYKSKFVNMFYSPAKTDEKKLCSFFKLICHVESDGTERVVGCHLMGKGVDEML